jgi:uncharacterized protein (TIGR02594 family)
MTLLEYAVGELGVKEIPGKEHNHEVLKYAKATGIPGIDTDEVPWCSTFINWCAMKAGLPMTKKPNARSWLNVGAKTIDPKPGDIVVFWRGAISSWKGHVGVFMGFSADGTKVFSLGGNQANAVSISPYDVSKVLGYRRLEKEMALVAPKPVLKKGDKGVRVTKLQNILNHLDYNCGDADGDFGAKTEQALSYLQANNQLQVDGVYGSNTKTIIESLMQE